MLLTASNKYAQDLGVGPFELGLVRSITIWVAAIAQMRFNNKHPIKSIDPPRHLFAREQQFLQQRSLNRKIVGSRAFIGCFSYTCAVVAFKFIPVVVFTVIQNTSAFFVAIFGWLISREAVLCIEMIFMVGSFSGITLLSIS